ncbi:nucleotidyltransferase [Flavobacterium bomense]|uniref:Nucleotidyltransferase n=1 Tax=Flavobacterium bomense TaxID=2497483 RepID=A0A432CNA4_9FLAO|nr:MULTISPECIES: nucleotidyltransferase substrate binding protein [Flavobacterium]RTY66244.1 nucleotidyltransferase [Flavobacterium sp. LB2P53]RTY94178.1 nucleotidyltransferase [Flavobacterium sp. GSN2]RTZ05528.1 nucleotidyltransferase [Flavobacterium bomense]RTZ06741.1 nucleotidyltransferase [Flavobacterium sp. GSP6]
MEEDIRCKQRFGNYLKALGQLQKFIAKGNLNELEELGLIQAFEFTHELAWNVMKDYFEYQGNTTITGSRDATREAFQKGLIQDGAQWMEMIKSRNQSTLTYNVSTANDIRDRILNQYYDLFVSFKEKMKEF